MRCQRSKKARETKKEALAAGLPAGFSHPSHIAGLKRCERRYRHKIYTIEKKRIQWRFESV